MANEIIYVRDGARFIQDGEPGEGLSSIEGFLTGVAEVSGNQARPYIAHFLPLGTSPEAFAISLTEAEARIVFSYFVGVAGVAEFSTYPRFRLYPMASYRTIGADFITPKYFALFTTRLTPFEITTKAATEALITCINNALNREKWLSALKS